MLTTDNPGTSANHEARFWLRLNGLPSCGVRYLGPTFCSTRSCTSISLICPNCGELWFKTFLYSDGASVPRPFTPRLARCDTCGDGHLCDAPFLPIAEPWPYLATVPELVKREIELPIAIGQSHASP